MTTEPMTAAQREDRVLERIDKFRQRRPRLLEDVVTLAHDMRSALEKVEAQDFDLLISDVGLPDGNGTELMATAKARSHLAGIAISHA